MIKIVFLASLLFAYATAGYLGTPLAYTAPVAVKAHIPVATSYQNTVQISAAPVPVVVKAAPFVAAPVLKTAPIFAAPAVRYALVPSIVKSPLIAAPYGYSHY